MQIINLLPYFSRKNERIRQFSLGEKITLRWLLQKQGVNLCYISQNKTQWRLLLCKEINVCIPQRQGIYGIAEQLSPYQDGTRSKELVNSQEIRGGKRAGVKKNTFRFHLC
jgi:hypothetical protein